MPHDSEPAKLLTTPLKNGGSASLAVNGSSTPVVFTYSPPVDYDAVLITFSLLFETTNALAFGNKFIDTTLATLTNGLLLECKAQDLAFTWQTMKRTRDVVEIAEDFDVVTGATNFFRVKVALPHELRLVKSGAFGADDYLRLTVRDDLRAFSFAEAFIMGSKI